ncbi:hypothetical protein IWQ60_004867 [Tieghemiomyces parasiticus]|uniref:DNA recombination and repair protein Rad51-like C-terminal domain-containing protein n=1 Tax=Tieghemiomyces parasiticus TaxID=78921 RepID=A0A9W8DTJ0_9FUNG|nr:hypothetical protein IWQ60_004867 [Tieghemiomyces parasiticus]
MPQLAFVAGLHPFVPDAQDRDRLFLKLKRLGIATGKSGSVVHDCSPVSIDLRCDSRAPTVDIQHHFGIPAIDHLLRGGVGAGDILEVVGTSDSGRTLLVHLMCSETVYQHARSRVIYVDTAAWFSVELLLDCLRYAWSRARDPKDTASGRTDFGRLSASPALVDSADNDPENSDSVVMRTTPFARASLERVQHVHCATADEVLAFIAGVMSTPVDEDVDFKGYAMPRPTLYVFDCLAPLLVTYLNSSAQGHSLVVTLSRALRTLGYVIVAGRLVG